MRALALVGMVVVAMAQNARADGLVDISNATVVVRAADRSNAEIAAADVLAEELEKRTGIALSATTEWPKTGPVIALGSEVGAAWSERSVPTRSGANLPEAKPEGYRLLVDTSNAERPVVWIVGADGRGALYGVGALLRNAHWAKGSIQIPADLDIATAPRYPIRGHQLGFRTQANSWDAWTPEQFDQYIRELTFFGLNSVENIPFQDERPTPVMKVSRQEMNRRMSEICKRYGLDYWVWTPADYDLEDPASRQKALDEHEAFYRECATLSGVFFPGGDPGDNPAQLVIPFLEDISKRLLPIHPEARVWLSLQHFNRSEIEYIMDYLERESPDWMGGIVGGPSSPPEALVRSITPKKYKYRLYPDITHNKICQYPVPWWDQAYSLTLGREAINPRPVQYAYIHNWFAPFSDGFISYSDGVHDDVNKTVYSAFSWDPDANLNDVVAEYARVFFGPEVANDAADGIFALEKNWRGPLKSNGAVEGTLLLWQALEQKRPELEQNWRWQMCLVRAYYDAYIRRRLLNETQLEVDANEILLECQTRGADAVMADAMAVLERAVEASIAPDIQARIHDLCEKLYQSCGLQTSVEKYHASGAERGAILDFVDHPLNNRWWLEDEFAKVKAMATETQKCDRLITIATWETPGFGSFYDDIGNPANCPRVKHSEEVFTEPGEEVYPEPLQWWWDQGMSRARLSWQNTMYPIAVVYDGLDPDATYVVRVSGYGQCLLRMDGELTPTKAEKMEMGDVREFPVSAEDIKDRRLELTWDEPTDEGHLNWRQHSRLAEVWLIKK